MRRRLKEGLRERLELVPYLLYEKEENGIHWIKFDRPEKLNATIKGSERIGTLARVGEYMRDGEDVCLRRGEPSWRRVSFDGSSSGAWTGSADRLRRLREVLSRL